MDRMGDAVRAVLLVLSMLVIDVTKKFLMRSTPPSAQPEPDIRIDTTIVAMTIHCTLQATDQDGCCQYVVCTMVGSVALRVDLKLD